MENVREYNYNRALESLLNTYYEAGKAASEAYTDALSREDDEFNFQRAAVDASLALALVLRQLED